MALATSPFTLKDTSLTLKLVGSTDPAQEYRCQLTAATLTPSDAGGGDNELVTFCTTHSEPSGGDSTWALELAGFQSFQSAQDLALFLFENEGARAEFVLLPGQGGGTISATNPGFTGTVTLRPTAIGGQARQFASFDVTLPLSARPSLITTAP